MTSQRRAPHHAQDHDGPWEHQNPRDAEGKPHRHLSAAQKASAKRHAEAAGRPYPNLVDNMREAAKAHGRPGSGSGKGSAKR